MHKNTGKPLSLFLHDVDLLIKHLAGDFCKIEFCDMSDGWNEFKKLWNKVEKKIKDAYIFSKNYHCYNCGKKKNVCKNDCTNTMCKHIKNIVVPIDGKIKITFITRDKKIPTDKSINIPLIQLNLNNISMSYDEEYCSHDISVDKLYLFKYK